MEEKRNLTVRCPECKKMNILTRKDFSGREKISFKCAACGHAVVLDNPDK